MKHSELPFHYFYSGSGGHDIMEDTDEITVATCQSGWALCADKGFELAGANAKFVTKACNNHYQLLEALKTVITQYSFTHDGADPAWIRNARITLEEAEK